MARPTKNNLDYFPQDVDFLQDIKICKLKRSQGGKAIAVWISLLCRIYGSDGYYMKWDKELPFFVSEELPGYDEVYVQEVITSCLNVGLLNKALFESERILTSAAIQRRFLEARRRIKLKNVDIINDKYRLIPTTASNVLAQRREQTPVCREETHVSTPTNPTKEKKEKEKKENTPSSVDDVVVAHATPSTTEKEEFHDPYLERASQDRAWLSSVASSLKVESTAKIMQMLRNFCEEQKLVGKTHENIIDAKRHFISWVKKHLANGKATNLPNRKVATDPKGYEGSF